MKKLFIMDVLEDSPYIVLPTTLRRLLGLTVSQKLYLFHSEDSYVLTLLDLDLELVKKITIESQPPDHLKIKLPAKLAANLAWEGHIFLYYQKNGAHLLSPAQPYCTSCKKLFNLSELYDQDGNKLCRKCVDIMNKRKSPGSRNRDTMHASTKETSKSEQISPFKTLHDFPFLLFQYEQNDQRLRSYISALEAFWVDAEEHYGPDTIELMRIYHSVILHRVSEYFYLSGQIDSQK